MRKTFILLFTCVLMACARAEPAGGEAAAPRATAPGQPEAVVTVAQRPVPVMVVDSARPIEEELRLFREALREPAGLEGGARSREALVRAFVRAVERQDTARLRALHLTAAEFAWFYYPFTVYTHRPYRQAPGLVWMLTEQNSAKGIARVLRRRGGNRLGYQAHECDGQEPQDLNILHRDCTLRLAEDPARHQLFGTILERDGRFKFVSYANRL